jgi:Domain of unknown function (DUF6378)
MDMAKQKTESGIVEEVLTSREKNYGPFRDVARTTQNFKKILHESKNWRHLSDSHKEGLEMIVNKISRMLNGNHKYLDNVIDIMGYAALLKIDTEERELDRVKQDIVSQMPAANVPQLIKSGGKND